MERSAAHASLNSTFEADDSLFFSRPAKQPHRARRLIIGSPLRPPSNERVAVAPRVRKPSLARTEQIDSDDDEPQPTRFATPARSGAKLPALPARITYPDFVRKIPRADVRLFRSPVARPARLVSIKASQVTTITATEYVIQQSSATRGRDKAGGYKPGFDLPIQRNMSEVCCEKIPEDEDDLPAKPVFAPDQEFPGAEDISEKEIAVDEPEDLSKREQEQEPETMQDGPVKWVEESAYLVDCDKEEEKYQQRADVLLKPYANRVILQRSVYRNGHSVVFFQYPKGAKQTRRMVRAYTMSQAEMGDQYMGFTVSENTAAYKCVCKALKYAGFKLSKGSAWNVLWTAASRNEIVGAMHPLQKTNHFPGVFQIGRKDNLWRNINRLKRIHGKDYNICPTTYVFPEDLTRFLHEKDAVDSQIWILKPQASSCGRGIKLLGPGNTVTIKG